MNILIVTKRKLLFIIKMDSFNLFILPASGGSFVVQLAILQHLSVVGCVPDLMLASSGGNIAAYIASAAEFQSAKIERVATDLKSSLFVTPWSNISMIAKTQGFFSGSVFDHGSGTQAFLKKYFTEKTILKYEVWTGAYNKQEQKFRVFCNKNKQNSILGQSDIDYNLTQSMAPCYADGAIDIIADASLASASIPGVVPATRIGCHEYVDGGNYGSSPISVMRNSIIGYLKNTNKTLHITYINSKNLSSIKIAENNNLFDTWFNAVENLLKSNNLIDRLTAYDLFNFFNVNQEIQYSEFVCNDENLLKINEIRKNTKYSMLEIYPNDNTIKVDITDFKGKDVKKAMDTVYNECMCNFWWYN
jgi:predicted patatin/cPLA2 family phospholipase